MFAARAIAQEPGAGAAQTVRPEVGKPIQAAIELIKSKKGKEALAKVREAQAVGDRTPYENYVVERQALSLKRLVPIRPQLRGEAIAEPAPAAPPAQQRS